MKIGNVRFWFDGCLLRSSNYKTHEQPLEMGITKYWKLPGVSVYETESESGGTEVRASIEVLWFYINIALFYTKKETRRWDDSGRKWGFYFMDRRNFVWRWGKFYWSFDIPFISSVFVKTEILSLDRKRVVHLCGQGIESFSAKDEAVKNHTASLPYKYELLKGESQDVVAAVHIERWTRRWKWTPFKTRQDSIWVNFSAEVGPERGSWKGGVTGCGWSMKRGESLVQCLRRMERERRFER